MPEIKVKPDPREVIDYNCTDMNVGNKKVSVRNSFGYNYYCHYVKSPTGNCQLASMAHVDGILPALDKYKFRDLMIRLRKEGFCKRLLMMDLKHFNADKIKSYVSPKTIVSEMSYTSSNGSNMKTLILKLSVIRQMKIPS